MKVGHEDLEDVDPELAGIWIVTLVGFAVGCFGLGVAFGALLWR